MNLLCLIVWMLVPSFLDSSFSMPAPSGSTKNPVAQNVFLQFSDMHYNPFVNAANYSGCIVSKPSHQLQQNPNAGLYGRFRCDSNLLLINTRCGLQLIANRSASMRPTKDFQTQLSSLCNFCCISCDA